MTTVDSVPRKTFFWIMGTALVIIMAAMSYLTGKVDRTEQTFNHSFTQVTNSISSINTSLEFINEDIRDIKENI